MQDTPSLPDNKTGKGLLVLILAEVLFFIPAVLFAWTYNGIYLPYVILVLLIIFSAVRPGYAGICSLIAIGAGCIIAMMTVNSGDPFIRLITFYVALAVCTVTFRFVNRTVPSTGQPLLHMLPNILLVLLGGQALGILIYLFLPVDTIIFSVPAVHLLLASPVTAYIEELYFRKSLQNELNKYIAGGTSVLVTAWVALAMSLPAGMMIAVIIFITHLILSSLYLKQRSMLLTWVLNTTLKTTVVLIYLLNNWHTV